MGESDGLALFGKLSSPEDEVFSPEDEAFSPEGSPKSLTWTHHGTGPDQQHHSTDCPGQRYNSPDPGQTPPHPDSSKRYSISGWLFSFEVLFPLQIILQAYSHRKFAVSRKFTVSRRKHT